MAGQHYCLRWNNYQSNMTSVFHQLLRNEAFVDVTLACNDSSLKAHKVVLSACSSYFQKLLLENPCKHPTIIMPQDVCFSDLKFIIEFVYRGEIDVSQAELQSLLKTADQLKIKGLCEVPDSKDGAAIPPGAEVTTSPIISRRSFTKLRRLSFSKKHRLNLTNNNLSNVDNRRCSFKCEPTNSGSPPPPLSLPPPPLTPQHMSSSPPLHPSTPTSPTTPPSPSAMQAHQHSLPPHQTHHSHQQMHSIHQLHEGAYSPHLDHLETNSMASHLLGGQEHSGLERVSEQNSVATSTEDDVPVVVLESPIQQQQLSQQQQHTPGQEHSPGMLMGPSMNSLDGGGGIGSTGPPSSGGVTDPGADVDLQPETQPTGPQATLVENMDLNECSPHDSHHDMQDTSDCHRDNVKVKFETLRAMEQAETIDIDSHMSERTVEDEEHSMHTMMITPELLGLIPSNSGQNEDPGPSQQSSANIPNENTKGTPKTWTQEDMELALDALRNHNMSLTRASATYGIPSTTLWQRAHRLGIDTPKKEGPNKAWTEDNLNRALEALRTGSISANKASKAYGIPSSTLYKIARREGIRLSAPFNAAPTTWNSDDLERALESIRSGVTSVQRASTEYGIPTGTLYGRCKREGIELSRSNPTPWSEDAMTEALEAVRIGQMSINQAAIHYNLPYSSLYGRFKRVKYEAEGHHSEEIQHHQHVSPPPPPQPQIMVLQYQQQPPPHAMFQQHAAS